MFNFHFSHNWFTSAVCVCPLCVVCCSRLLLLVTSFHCPTWLMIVCTSPSFCLQGGGRLQSSDISVSRRENNKLVSAFTWVPEERFCSLRVTCWWPPVYNNNRYSGLKNCMGTNRIHVYHPPAVFHSSYYFRLANALQFMDLWRKNASHTKWNAKSPLNCTVAGPCVAPCDLWHWHRDCASQ